MTDSPVQRRDPQHSTLVAPMCACPTVHEILATSETLES